MSMTRTTVYLSDDAKRRLTRAAKRRQQSEAELIRKAIEDLLAEEPARPIAALPTFDDLDPALPDRVDEALAGGFGADGFSWRDAENSDAKTDR